MPELRTFTAAAAVAGVFGAPRCDFKPLDAADVTGEQFEADYLAGKIHVPMLLRNAFAWTEELASQEAVRRSFGNLTISVTTRVESQSRYKLQPAKERMPLAAWMDRLGGENGAGAGGAPAFLFYNCGDGPECVRAVAAAYGVPPAMRSFTAEVFLSGGAESLGVAMHVHGPTWVASIAGRKAWYAMPPTRSPPQWVGRHRPLAELRKDANIWQCTQRAGEVVFLPGGWWHATANVGQWSFNVGAQEHSPGAHLDAVFGNATALGRRSAAELRLANKIGKRPLHAAAYHGHVAAVELLLEVDKQDGACASKPCRDGRWPLHYAAINGQAAVAELLLQRRAEPTAAALGGGAPPPLLLAAENGHAEVAELLLRAGAEPAERGGQDGRTALHAAAFHGHAAAAEALLAGGRQRPPPAALLGAAVEGSDEGLRGQQALHLAAQQGHVPVVELLLAHRASVDAASDDGDEARPLHLAAREGRRAVAELLLRRSAQAEASTERGDTAADLARRAGYRDLAKLLTRAERAQRRRPSRGPKGEGRAAEL